VIENVNTWADVVRWCAFGGAALAIWPLARWLRIALRRYIDEGRRKVVVSLLGLIFAAAAMVAFLVFALVAGSIIPFTSRVTGFNIYDPTFETVMAVAWTAVAIGAWLSALALRRSRRWVAGAGFFGLLAVIFAASATAG